MHNLEQYLQQDWKLDGSIWRLEALWPWKDDRSRSIGGAVTVQAHSEVFWVRCWAFRNKRPFGAFPPMTVHQTLEGAKESAREKLLAQGQRYFLKFGRMS